jgi:hypothetical protein
MLQANLLTIALECRGRQVYRFLQFLCVLICLTSATSGQDFVLENPADPAGSSVAAIVGTDLVITDAAGRQFVYVRRPDLDSADGRYQAFFSAEANQNLRWPVSGTGSMQIGTRVRGKMDWTPSRMQVRSAAGGPVEPGAFIPGGPLNIGTIPLGPDKLCAAQIDAAGQLQFFIGHGERWRHFAADHAPGVLVPGAPVQLVADPASTVPRVITIGSQGKFVEIVGGRTIGDLPAPPDVRFVPGGHFASVQTAAQNSLYATERHGRLWRIDLAAGKHEIIEGHLGVLEPGLPIQTLSDGRELFMTDRQGAIVVYSLDPMKKWQGPENLFDGFASAGDLAVWLHPGTTAPELAAVDRDGKLRVMRLDGGMWKTDSPSGITLPPGSPLTAFETKSGLSVTAILADGRWAELYQSGGAWQNRILATGFPVRAPLAFSGFGPMLFASDITGRLVGAYWIGDAWQTVIVVPSDLSGGQVGFAPRLISRKFIANRRVDPVVVELQNTTPEELVVRIRDGRMPGKTE